MAFPGLPQAPNVRVADAATERLLAQVEALKNTHGSDRYHQKLTERLGAHAGEDHVTFGAWMPISETIGAEVELEVIHVLSPYEWGAETDLDVAVFRHPMQRLGEYVWLALQGCVVGHRERLGALYRFVVTRAEQERYWGDPLAASLPFGLHGPAEVYDTASMHDGRDDLEYFRRQAIAGDGEGEPTRFGPPAHILQVHVGTATRGGTLADLTDRYRALADKLNQGETLTPADQEFLGFEAIELLPIEPPIEPRTDGPAFALNGASKAQVRPVRTVNWGYDTGLFGAAAVAPSLLRTGRPDELVDLASVLHTMPGKPLRLMLDVVYGHADAEALNLLPPPAFLGRNMYGVDLDYTNPQLRAMVLEMQRRKVNYGADGLRVDAAQDHKVWDKETLEMVHDDDFLEAMSDVTNQVGDATFRPFMVFEDGRPWPRPDWPTASTYLDVIERQPHAFQWGPLTFAHNTPSLEGYWASVESKLQRIAWEGANWITGTANHDTLRRGYQLEVDSALNRRLGDDLPSILERSYRLPAADALFYGVLPGVPLTLLQSRFKAPWGFFRDSDDEWAAKVATEERPFLTWRVRPEAYENPSAFPRMKARGFLSHRQLSDALDAVVQAVGRSNRSTQWASDWLQYRRRDAALALPTEELEAVLRDWFRDMADYCNIEGPAASTEEHEAASFSALKQFRVRRPWLRTSLRTSDRFDVHHAPLGVWLVVERMSPDGAERVAALANLEGETVEADVAHVLSDAAWQVAWSSHGAHWDAERGLAVLPDGEAIIFEAGL